MIRFSGVEAFSFPRTTVVEKLSDASFLATCVPDAAIRSATRDEAEWRAKAKLGFATATLESKLVIHERQPAVAFELTNRTAGASLAVTTRLAFSEKGTAETEVAWTAEVTARTGLLKLVPASTIQSQIESLLGDLWSNVREKLQACGPPAP